VIVLGWSKQSTGSLYQGGSATSQSHRGVFGNILSFTGHQPSAAPGYVGQTFTYGQSAALADTLVHDPWIKGDKYFSL